MRLLAFDSATNACSAALWLDDGPGPARYEPMRRGHGEALVPMIGQVMAEAGLSFGDLDGIAVTVGPGAFTGLRIGLSAARGLALAAALPLVGVNTLAAVASVQESTGLPLLVVLDSKRADVYAQLFSADGLPLTPPAALAPEHLQATLPPDGAVAIAGDAADTVIGILGESVPLHRLAGPDLPDAAAVAKIAVGRLAEHPHAFDTPPEALYLRPPDAIPAAERRRRARQ